MHAHVNHIAMPIYRQSYGISKLSNSDYNLDTFSQERSNVFFVFFLKSEIIEQLGPKRWVICMNI